MKNLILNILSPGNLHERNSLMLLLLRITTGGLMLMHGMSKLSMLLSGEVVAFPDPLGVGTFASLSLAVFAEVFCSMLIIFGLATRFAAIPLLITMLIAVLIIHAGDAFGKKELPLLYSLIFAVIAVFGAGKYSLDYWLSRKIS